MATVINPLLSHPATVVLSPPCGMATVIVLGLGVFFDFWFQAHRVGWRRFLCVYVVFNKSCSKPTAWDGDKRKLRKSSMSSVGSKPTVWDGDSSFPLLSALLIYCSKPTVWDGDSTEE